MGYTFCILSRVLLSFFIISHLSIILQLFIVLFYILFEGQNSCGQEVISLDTILRLRELMNSRGWSEYRLAKESKLSMSTISNIFHRGSIPSIPTLETLCNTFGISLGQFFSKGVSFKWSKQKFVCGKIMVKRKITAKLAVIFLKNGGPNRDRTDDLTDANRTLSQLSYAPIGLLCDYKIFFAVCQVFGGGLEKFFFAAPVFMPSACRHRPSFRAWSIPQARRESALSCCCCCRRRGIPY